MTEFSLVKMDEVPKRKRGRPPKIQHPVNPLLEFPTSHLTEQEAKDLLLGYKILKDILNIPKIKPFLDKPDESSFGLHDYYTIIDQPMWLNEVSRKYTCQEYTNVKTVIDDIRLILENCYKFWGHRHKFIKLAFRVEKLLEKHIKEFPTHLKSLCSLGEPDENNLDTDTENTDSSFLIEEYHSKILQNLEKKQTEVEEDITCEELQKWEADVLMSKQKLKQISLMPELAEIGHFLRLAQNILCLKEITQYEIERMLLMSKESTTLASIMTCFLCPTAMRGSLYFKPIMIYDVWVSLLNRKLEGWYNAYAKFNDKLQVFQKYGIEPYFWETVGDRNPLADVEFHALSFTKKACILKALCTTMFHSNKKIEDYFNSLDEQALRGLSLYEDSKFEYISLFSPEIRIYRISKAHIDIERILDVIVPNFNDDKNIEERNNSFGGIIPQQKPACSKRQKFYLIASTKESLKGLLKTVSKKKKSVNTIQSILSKEDTEKQSIKGLKAMFSQWRKSLERTTSFIENSVNYWLNKEISPDATPQNNSQLDSFLPDVDTQTEPILGKRILKRKFSLEDVETSSNDEKFSEGSVSDWEDGNIRRSKRIKRAKSVPRFFDRRFMRFERKNFEDAIFEHSYSMFNGNLIPKSPEPIISINQNFNKLHLLNNQMLNRGVRIKKAPIMTTKKSIVNAAVENASKLILPVPNSDSKILTIDMKNGQNLPPKTLLQNHVNQIPWMSENQYSPIVYNKLPSNIFNCYSQKYLAPNDISFEEHSLENVPHISVPNSNFFTATDNSSLHTSMKHLCVPSSLNEPLNQDFPMKEITIPNLAESEPNDSFTKSINNFPSQNEQILYLPQYLPQNPYNKFIKIFPSSSSNPNQVSYPFHFSKFLKSTKNHSKLDELLFSDEGLTHRWTSYKYVKGRVYVKQGPGRPWQFSIKIPDGGLIPLRIRDVNNLLECTKGEIPTFVIVCLYTEK